MITIRLGLLFLRGAGRKGLLRLALLVIGTAVGVWCLLAAIGFPSMLEARQARAADRWPVSATDDANQRGWYQQVAQRVDGRELTIVFIARGENTPIPPGLTVLPSAGQAAASPALQRLVADKSEDFPYRVVGSIDDAGLVAPDELFAYVSVDRSALNGNETPLGRFGVTWSPEIDLTKGDLRLAQYAFLGLVGIPLAVYFAVCVRLSAASRDRRLAALRLIGMTARDTRRVNLVEAVVAAIGGSALGLMLFNATRGAIASSGVGGLVWFPHDATPSVPTLVLCLLGIPAMAAFLSRVGSRAAVNDALAVRRQANVIKTSWWRLVPLAIGVMILTGLLIPTLTRPLGQGVGPSGPLFMLVGVLCTGIGLALGFGPLAMIAARSLGGRARRLWLQLGMRRLEFEPSSATRVVTGLVVVVFGVGFSSGLLRDAQAAAEPLGDVVGYRVHASQLSDDARDGLRSIKGVEALAVSTMSYASPPSLTEAPSAASGPGSASSVGGSTSLAPPAAGQGPVSVLFATCADLRVLLNGPLTDCVDGMGYRLQHAGQNSLSPSVQPGRTIPLLARHEHDPGTPEWHAHEDAPTVSAKVPERVLTIPAGVTPVVVSDVVLPPDQMRALAPEAADYLLLSSTGRRVVEEVSRGISQLAPSASFDILDGDADARQRAETLRGLLQAALALGVLVGLAAFVVATLDRAVERRGNLVALQVVGVPAATLRAAQAAGVVLPLTVGTLLAVVAGKLAEQVTVGLGGYVRTWTWGPPAIALLAGLAAAALAAAVTMLAVSRRLDVSLVRRD